MNKKKKLNSRKVRSRNGGFGRQMTNPIFNRGRYDAIREFLSDQTGAEIETVHDNRPAPVRIDAFVAKPTTSRPYQTVITAGSSYLPMNLPPEDRDLSYTELMLALPPDWDLTSEASAGKNRLWPVTLMTDMIRAMQKMRGFLIAGVFYPDVYSDGPAFPAETGVKGMLLCSPSLYPQEIITPSVPTGRITLLTLNPLYENELNLYHSLGLPGAVAVSELLAQTGQTELLDPANLRAPFAREELDRSLARVSSILQRVQVPAIRHRNVLSF